MQGDVYLFADTNLFIECRPLQDLEWRTLPECAGVETVHLMVSRPVQREVEKLGHRSSDRVRKRAKKAYSVLRQTLAPEANGETVVRTADPQVRLRHDGPGQPDEGLATELDYTDPDDRLIGYGAAYRRRNPEQDVRILSHDTGVVATARSLGIPAALIPEDWLLDPERNEAEKTNERLQARIRELEAGPEFTIRARATSSDGPPHEIDVISATAQAYAPLNRREIATAMQIFRRLAEWPDVDFSFGAAHQKWLSACEEQLSGLHEALTLQRKGVPFIIAVANVGTQPARATLVQIAGHKAMKVRPVSTVPRVVEWETRLRDQAASIPRPPRTLADLAGGLGDAIKIFPDAASAQRHPDVAYYTPHYPSKPNLAYVLERERWRHGVAPQTFYGEIIATHENEQIEGQLKVTVHAENLHTPATRGIPVRITVERLSALECALALASSISAEHLRAIGAQRQGRDRPPLPGGMRPPGS